jgi:hypothetical protein
VRQKIEAEGDLGEKNRLMEAENKRMGRVCEKLARANEAVRELIVVLAE